MCGAEGTAVPTDDVIRAAVEAADTYQAAAIALGMQYPKLYSAAQRLGATPKSVAAKRAARKQRGAAAPWRPSEPKLREPAPEPEPPRLGPWIAPPGPGDRTIAVRLDQKGRVRAEVTQLDSGWCGWAIRDATGAVVGKLGLRGGLRPGEARRDAQTGADEALAGLGWLPAGYTAPTELCAHDGPVCSAPRPEVPVDPIVALAERLLAARRSERADLGAELARLVVNRATEQHIDAAKDEAPRTGRAAA